MYKIDNDELHMCEHSTNPNINASEDNSPNTHLKANLEDSGALHWKLRAHVVCLGDLRTDDNLGKPRASEMKMQQQSLFGNDKI